MCVDVDETNYDECPFLTFASLRNELEKKRSKDLFSITTLCFELGSIYKSTDAHLLFHTHFLNERRVCSNFQ